ncbi:MAG: hypothetical protein HXK17_06225 [Alloprevotella sp.]|jgi:hypothetical protein|nr:hypothetical protein [Alloprevotella sp.]RKV81288.1 MAG: hypothetical protein D8H91_03305 [Alloprevotella sp.]
MNTNEQTLHQIERALKKTAEKFAAIPQEDAVLTDFYLLVRQESGELLVFDDDEHEITRCVVEEWIGNSSEDFYTAIQPVLQAALKRCAPLLEEMSVLRPCSFVLLDDEQQTVAELFLIDDDTMILGQDLMVGLSDDLDAFWQKLSAE